MELVVRRFRRINKELTPALEKLNLDPKEEAKRRSQA
jgi:hypothetical protein